MDPCTKRVLSICSGIGGIELGLAALEPITGERFETICYLELEISAGRVLAKNIQEGKLGDAPIWTDMRAFNSEPWSGKVDIIAGGFPCQPHSQAGKQRHGDDPRELSGEVLRIARELGKPTLFLENVPGISRYYFDFIRPQLREMGYEIKEGFYSAQEIGAPQKRERIFILADSNSKPRHVQKWSTRAESNSSIKELAYSEHEGYEKRVQPETTGNRSGQVGQELADSECIRTQISTNWEHSTEQWTNSNRSETPLFPPGPNDHEGWTRVLSEMPEIKPSVCRVSHGVPPGYQQRIRALGNAVVPAVAAIAWVHLNRAFERGEVKNEDNIV